MLSREQAFDLWAGATSPWAVWCKPIAFAHLPPTLTPSDDTPPPPVPAVPWAPPADGSTIVLIDLPGMWSVRLGEALVHVGFRPIPLFNAVPGPEDSIARGRGDLSRTVVDVYPTIDAIGQVTLRAGELLQRLPTMAPPAFLLDGDRGLGHVPSPGDFDNRSISLPTDFPSATFLQAQGVRRAIVVLRARSRAPTAAQPATDLAHTLLRWQAAGITILACPLNQRLAGPGPQKIDVARPSWFGAIWHNALSVLGLRRDPMGGFGGKLPVPSSGG